MFTTLLLFQAFFTATGNCAALVLMGVWLVCHPAERGRLRLLSMVQADAQKRYEEQLQRRHLFLAALDELFLWVNWWFAFPVRILSWMRRHRREPISWFSAQLLMALPIVTSLPLAVSVGLSWVTRDSATLAAAGTLTLFATIRVLALACALRRQ